MKNEKQIRRVIEQLMAVLNTPCGCKGTKHQFECEAGSACVAAQMRGLLWVLGKVPDHELLGQFATPDILEGN